MFDVKIVGGTILDGSGAFRYKADVGIEGDKITAIGDLSSDDAKKVIDASGKFVSPGFIDFHTHSDLSLVYDKYTRSRIHTGVTMDVIANCGIGVAPIREERKQELIDYLGTRIIGTIPAKLELPWNTMEEYFTYLEENAPAVNVAAYVAHGAIRIDEMGFSKEAANTEQMEHMKAEVRKAMETGCIALSTGLVYLPGAYTKKEELAELCKELKPYNGYYISHIRDEGDEEMEALAGAGSAALVLGLVGGYPIGAKTAADLYRENLVSREEAERLLAFCNNSNPVFLISVLGVGVFGSVRAGVWLWLIHVLSALLTGLVFRGSGKSASRQELTRHPPFQAVSFAEAFTGAVRSSLAGILSVCAFVVFFYVLAQPLTAMGGRLGAVLVAALELFSLTPLLTADAFGFLLAAAAAGWGGLSVLCQTLAVLEGSGLRLRNCFLGKVVQSAFSLLLAALLVGYVLG